MILVDSNVLLDVLTDNDWADWSEAKLEGQRSAGGLAINDVIYAELSVRYDTIEAADDVVEAAGLLLLPTPRPALFLAGKAFQRYRRAGGTRTGVLPDFFIGAHALLAGMALLTRDARRYRTYFPALRLIAPD